ncbi:hypothetical protein niasHT_017981 [Heterodera trifolii]|uniref:Nuclear receptor domain-containing protein n=1 Tax=Heterodera trifolii TaxID=157864 RepID=A0ABD2LDX9_9BILA
MENWQQNKIHRTEIIVQKTEQQNKTNNNYHGQGRPKCQLSNCKICGRQCLYSFYGVKSCESCKQFFRRVVTKQILFTCPRRNGFGNMAKCRGCRLDKCLMAGMNPTLINVPQSDKFKQFLANLEKRKRSAMLMQKIIKLVLRQLRTGNCGPDNCGRQLRTTIADRTFADDNCGRQLRTVLLRTTIADDNCGPYFCGRQLRTVLLRTTIADDNCGPYFCGRQLRTTIADRTFADDNCGPYFCGRQLRTTIADRTFADDNCGRQLRTVLLRTTIADDNCGPMRSSPNGKQH